MAQATNRLSCLFGLALVLVVRAEALAQPQTGNLHGTVVDEQGDPISGATVTLTGAE